MSASETDRSDANRDTLMAFDFGLRRIGVAVGSRRLSTSSALTTLHSSDAGPDFEAIGALLREWQPGLVVVGRPVDMDGSENDMTRKALRFARRIRGRFSLPVALVDERLSSVEAQEMIRTARRAGRRRRARAEDVDKLAAEVILRSFLEHGGDELRDDS